MNLCTNAAQAMQEYGTLELLWRRLKSWMIKP